MVPKPLAYLKSQEEANTAASCALPGVPTQRSLKINLSLTRALRMILGWPSIILQALVDDTLIFRDLCVGTPGSAHDAAVFASFWLFR